MLFSLKSMLPIKRSWANFPYLKICHTVAIRVTFQFANIGDKDKECSWEWLVDMDPGMSIIYIIMVWFLEYIWRSIAMVEILIKSVQAVWKKRYNSIPRELCEKCLHWPFPKQALVFTCLHYNSFENTEGKGEIARNEQFVLFPQWRTFCQCHQIKNCDLQTLSVWKSLKFVAWERVKSRFGWFWKIHQM